jgi:hypothetical protein
MQTQDVMDLTCKLLVWQCLTEEIVSGINCWEGDDLKALGAVSETRERV